MRATQAPKPEYNFVGTRAKLLVSGKESGGAFCMMEIDDPPGASTPWHMHGNEEETIRVMEGVIAASLNSEIKSPRAGDTIVLPRKPPHRLVNTSERNTRCLVICTPAGFENFVDACADAQFVPGHPAPPTPQDVERLIAASGHLGITILPSAS